MGQVGDLPKIDGKCEAATLPGGLVAASFGNIGVAVYPGQSAKDILKIADIIQRELDKDFFGHYIDHYLARDIARKVLLYLNKQDIVRHKSL
jgi:hypothetical protein